MLKSVNSWVNNLKKISPTFLKKTLKPQAGLQQFIAKAVAGTFGLKIVNTLLLYLNNILLARLLGLDSYGVYNYARAWMALLVIPAALGLEGLILRELAVYRTKSDWGLARGVVKWGNQIALINSILITALATGIFWLAKSGSDREMAIVFAITMISLPITVLVRLRIPAMQSLDRIVLGQIPEGIISPSIFIVLLLILGPLLNLRVDAVTAALCSFIAAAIAYYFGSVWLQKSLAENIQKCPPEYKPKTWFKMALPMLFIGSMYIINNQADTIMLGLLSNTKEVALYTVANRGSSLISFVLMAFDASLSPTFASLYAQGNIRKLQEIVTKSCRIIFGSAFFATIILLVFGKWLLLIFGTEFTQGQGVLNILSIGQLIHSFTGSVAMLLIMTGHEKDTAIGVGISAVINIILNSILIPLWGAEGAATATAISLICWNVILLVFAAVKLKVISAPFGRIKTE